MFQTPGPTRSSVFRSVLGPLVAPSLRSGHSREDLSKNETMAPLHVATLAESYLNMRLYLPYLCTRNETMAPLHVATLTVQRELPKYEIIFSI